MISKHDSRELIAEVERSAGLHLDVPRSAQVEILEPDKESKFVIIDGRFTFVRGGDDGGTMDPFYGNWGVDGLYVFWKFDGSGATWMAQLVDAYLVAAGSAQSYFGHDELAVHAPGMKTIDDALEVRGRIFGAFELPNSRRIRPAAWRV